MSKSRRRRDNHPGRSEVSFTTSNQRLPSPIKIPTPLRLSQVEDRRRYSPTFKTAKSITGGPSRIGVAKKTQKFRKPKVYDARLPHKLQFLAPLKTVICLKRKIRKEVIHALRLTKKGAGAKKHRNSYTGVKC